MNADHVGAAGRDDVADQRQLAGFVLQGNHQVGLATAHDQASGNDPAEDIHIDVAARDQADGLFAGQGQLTEESRRHRSGPGALGHQLLVFHQREDGRGNLVLADRDHIVHVLLHHPVGGFAGGFHRDAVRKGIHPIQRLVLMVVERPGHAGSPRRLHAVDLDLRPQALDGKSHAGDQPAAAHRHDDRIHVGQLVQNLQSDGSLPRNDQLVIVGVDEGHAGFLLQFHRPVVGVVVGALDQLHLGSQPLGAFHLHDGGAVRHADHTADAHAGGRQGYPLGVVARRTGNDALGALFRGELADFVVGATHLETAGDLQVLGLQVQIGARAQPRCGDQIGLARDLLENEFGVIDLVQGQHGRLPPVFTNSTARSEQSGPGFGLLRCNLWRLFDYS